MFQAGKDVENRPWSTMYRGRLWIHAGAKTARAKHDRWAAAHGLWVPEEPLPRGVILGSVDLVDVVHDSESPWALRGQNHWILRRPMVLGRPIDWTGRLGMTYIARLAGDCAGLVARARATRRKSMSHQRIMML
jgi:hypothetical protein